MDVRRLLLSGALAGTAMALLSRLPLVSLCNLFFCGWIWAGSLFAAWHYNYLGSGGEGPGETITPPQGAAVGALSGVIAALAGGLIYYYMLLSFGAESLISTASQLVGVDESLFWESLPQTGLSDEALLAVIDLLINLVVFVLIGAIGGGIGAALIARRRVQREID